MQANILPFEDKKEMNLVPREVFFTSGVGKHRHKLQSFELAFVMPELPFAISLQSAAFSRRAAGSCPAPRV